MVKNPLGRANFHELAALFQQPIDFEIQETGEFKNPLQTIEETKKEDLTTMTERSDQKKTESFYYSFKNSNPEDQTKEDGVFLKSLFLKNSECLREFGNVHNCHTSKYKNPKMDLERTAENTKIDLVDDFEMIEQTKEGPLQVETPSEIDYDNILKKLLESSENHKGRGNNKFQT